MGQGQSVCAVAGTSNILGEYELHDEIFGVYDGQRDSQTLQRLQCTISNAQRQGMTTLESGSPWSVPSKEVMETLVFSKEDVEASNDCVLIAGYRPLEGYPDAIGPLYCQGAALVEEPCDAIAIFDVTPQNADDGIYTLHRDKRVQYRIRRAEHGFFINFAAYCIFKTVAPGLGPSDLYKFFKQADSRDCIDYGVVTATLKQNALQRTATCGDMNPMRWWLQLLCDRKRSSEEIYEEAWRGQGNLWAFSRPDRFPIAQCFSAPSPSAFRVEADFCASQLGNFPLDILFLICEELPLNTILNVLSLSRVLRATLLPEIDQLAHKALKNVEPWYFPSKPVKTPDGYRERDDLDWWEAQWFIAGGIAPGDIRLKAPWLRYWIQCIRSPSMRNRKRIWGVSEQIKTLLSY